MEHYSEPTNLTVREETHLFEPRDDSFTVKKTKQPFQLSGTLSTDERRQRGLEAQQNGTSREYQPSAAAPSQMRPGELRRDVVPKNIVEFEAVGRNIGPHGTADAVGAYVGTEADVPLTQRAIDTMEKPYFNPTPAFRFGKPGNVPTDLAHNRINARPDDYKNTPGRFNGPHAPMLRPDHPNEELWRKTGHKPKDTMKSDPHMVHKIRVENPNGERMRVQYSDIGPVSTHKRKQHTVTTDIDPSMISAYAQNPYTPKLGIIPIR